MTQWIFGLTDGPPDPKWRVGYGGQWEIVKPPPVLDGWWNRLPYEVQESEEVPEHSAEGAGPEET